MSDLTISKSEMEFAKLYNLSLTELYFYIYTQKFSYNNYYDFLNDFPIFKLKHKTLQRIIRRLKDIGLLPNEIIKDEEEVKKEIVNKDNTSFICEWCGDKVYVLQEHHYPIPKSKGGIETVNICPNCHYGFHHLIGTDWDRTNK